MIPLFDGSSISWVIGGASWDFKTGKAAIKKAIAPFPVRSEQCMPPCLFLALLASS